MQIDLLVQAAGCRLKAATLFAMPHELKNSHTPGLGQQQQHTKVGHHQPEITIPLSPCCLSIYLHLTC